MAVLVGKQAPDFTASAVTNGKDIVKDFTLSQFKGKHVVFDVDVKGGVNLKNQFGNDALAVFIKPPSVESLRNRLLGRNTETEETLKTRLDRAVFELGFEDKFDVVIVNDNLESAKKESLKLVNNFIKS